MKSVTQAIGVDMTFQHSMIVTVLPTTDGKFLSWIGIIFNRDVQQLVSHWMKLGLLYDNPNQNKGYSPTLKIGCAREISYTKI